MKWDGMARKETNAKANSPWPNSTSEFRQAEGPYLNPFNPLSPQAGIRNGLSPKWDTKRVPVANPKAQRLHKDRGKPE
jgi:hypothetical protein